MRICIVGARALVDALVKGIDEAMANGQHEFDVDVSALSDDTRSQLQATEQVDG